VRTFLSVVIPTLNRRETLAYGLPALARQTWPASACEILLCDSGSTDGTGELVDELRIPNLRLLAGENLGRAAARNRGIREAQGDIVVFTDADILADADWLAEHARAHGAANRIAAVGCEVQVDSLEEYQGAVEDPRRRRRLHPDRRRRLSWLFFLTGNASVRRDDLTGAGLFDESFTGYGHEDLELGYRLEKIGLAIRYRPGAVNYHWHRQTFEARLEKMRLAGRSTVRFYQKHRDPWIKLRLGVNPLSRFLHGRLPETGRLVAACRRRHATSALCREIALQHAYLCGVRAALTRGEADW
jgi:GT2 family glycosyltransferase